MKTIFTASGIMTLNYTLHLPHIPDTLIIVYFFCTDTFSDLIHVLKFHHYPKCKFFRSMHENEPAAHVLLQGS